MDEDSLLEVELDSTRSLCIGTLSKPVVESIQQDFLSKHSEYFIFEVDNSFRGGGIRILGSTLDLEAAYRLFDLIRALMDEASRGQRPAHPRYAAVR